MSRSNKKDFPNKFDSRRFDHSCRNHGKCSYCKRNRLFFDKKARTKANKNEELADMEESEAEEFDNWFESIL